MWQNLQQKKISQEGMYIFQYMYESPYSSFIPKINITFINFESGEYIIKHEFWIEKNPYRDADGKMEYAHFRGWKVGDEPHYPTARKENVYYIRTAPNYDLMKIVNLGVCSTVSSAKRLKVFERDRYSCKFCQKSPALDHAVKLQIDHIFPASYGGSNHLDNLQTLCMSCNQKKSNKVGVLC